MGRRCRSSWRRCNRVGPPSSASPPKRSGESETLGLFLTSSRPRLSDGPRARALADLRGDRNQRCRRDCRRGAAGDRVPREARGAHRPRSDGWRSREARGAHPAARFIRPGSRRTLPGGSPSRHPEWGGALAGFFKQPAGRSRAHRDERDDLQQKLAQFAGNPAIQALLAETVVGRRVNRRAAHRASHDGRRRLVVGRLVDTGEGAAGGLGRGACRARWRRRATMSPRQAVAVARAVPAGKGASPSCRPHCCALRATRRGRATFASTR